MIFMMTVETTGRYKVMTCFFVAVGVKFLYLCVREKGREKALSLFP